MERQALLQELLVGMFVWIGLEVHVLGYRLIFISSILGILRGLRIR